MDSGMIGRDLPRPISPVARHVLACVSLCLLLAVCSGCRSLRPSDGEGLFAAKDVLSTSKIRGPLERAFYNEEDALTRGEKFSPEAMATVELARKQFTERQYPQALKNYKSIAKKYPESSIGEEAWFRMGECHYAMRQYPKAQDAYDKLFADYPSTKYVSDASQRLFDIAKIWLEVSDPVAKSVIKTVSDEKTVEDANTPPPPSSSPSARYGLIPNFFDERRPVFDTRGRAKNALKAIWLNDPTGPLADDALMLTASYYLKKGNYLEADRYFEILRDEYPDSPHLEDAFVMGSHVKQMAYQGPYYDGTSLVSAENLKERALMLFPSSEDRPKMREELKRIYLLKAQRAWSQVQLWKKKDNPRSVAIASMQLILDYPDTRYAEMARQEIRRIDPRRIQHLPGMAEFLKSLPDSEPASPATDEATQPQNADKSGSAEGSQRGLPGI